jgi:hypothetical protein
MVDYRNPLGLALSNAFGEPSFAPTQQPQTQMPAVKMPSKGQMIAGILADALAGAGGRQGQFAQHLGQLKQQEREQAQWGLQRQAGLEDYEAKQRIEQRYRQPEVSPMVRDATAWAGMTPEQQAAYGQMKQAGAGDPDVFITLPNGQVYAGPKSGLQAAMMGGAPAPSGPPRPVGKLRPYTGGPASQAPATFRP